MWIPIALSRDVPPGVTRSVILDGAERVVWRAANGDVQVWEDRCPHRGMRLSFGFVRGNALNCLYHGWEYAAAGRCVRIPAHPDLQVPGTIRARAFPVAEAGGLIWTRETGNDDLPRLPPSAPLASVAVDAGKAAILALCHAVPDATAQLVTASLDGIALAIGWHPVSPARTMLHATVVGAAADAAALAALHRLRDRAELEAAA
jgi:phenylpropionate dioxygenase-like ring-hydroxylating dioxygenase large terminal subunit